MITVKATREGLLGQKTATGDVLDRKRPIVALPSTKALDTFVRVVNPLNGKQQIALVDDVGPFNEHDDAYVFQPSTMLPPSTMDPRIEGVAYVPVRPQAESGVSVSGKGTNGAGIDLGEVVWAALGMLDNTDVQWEFVT